MLPQQKNKCHWLSALLIKVTAWDKVFYVFFHFSKGLFGLSISYITLKTLNKFALNLKVCKGQCYDVAGQVSSKINGCQVHILSKNRLALYTHLTSFCKF